MNKWLYNHKIHLEDSEVNYAAAITKFIISYRKAVRIQSTKILLICTNDSDNR